MPVFNNSYFGVVQNLIVAGAPKNQQNAIGWTPLHEACFYNRVEVVKALLLSGADASIRTYSGALPYHLAGLQMIRTMLSDMGGPSSVPEAGDVVDMVAILTELTIAETTIVAGADGSFQVIRTQDQDQDSKSVQQHHHQQQQQQSNRSQRQITSDQHSENETPAKSRVRDEGSKQANENPETAEFLHTGAVLGNLPAFTGAKSSSPSKSRSSAEGQDDVSQAIDYSSPHRINLTADDKSASKHKKKKKTGTQSAPKDMPTEFLCSLSRKPMSEPVKSTYGHIFDKSTIVDRSCLPRPRQMTIWPSLPKEASKQPKLTICMIFKYPPELKNICSVFAVHIIAMMIKNYKFILPLIGK